jgi:hypothetical protein
VASGVLVGSIIGTIAGGAPGAAIGAAAGAGAGAIVQKIMTRGNKVTLPPETQVTFRLDQPLNVGTPDNGFTKTDYITTTVVKAVSFHLG